MALDKLVDSTQLDSDLTSVANAIRTKGGTSAQLAFPAGFVSAIGDIPSGGGSQAYYFSDGRVYVEDIVFPDTITNLTASFNGATNVKTISGLAQTTTGAPANQFRNLTNMESIVLPRACHLYAWAVASATKLKTAEFGSVGYPVTVVRNTAFQSDTQNDLTITMYVNASTLAEAQAITDVGTTAPWGATNATIIYKSSSTGAVLT